MIDALRQAAESPLAVWVAGSIVASVVAAHLLWLLRRRGADRHRLWPWGVQAARFAFHLGVPYLALGGWPRPPFSALLSLEDLGLVGAGPRWPAARWLESLGTGLGLGLAAFLLLLLAWAGAHSREAGPGLRFPPRSAWALGVDGLLLQAHWAFYRGALAVASGELYTGVFAGLGLVYAEWALSPSWRRGWRDPAQAAQRWLRLGLALLAALTFLLTRNLWVCLAIHWALELAFWRLGRAAAVPADQRV